MKLTQDEGETRLDQECICILRGGPIDHDKRTQQVGLALAHAGAAVTIVSVSPQHSKMPMPDGIKTITVWPGPPSEHRYRGVRVMQNLVRHVRQHRLLLREARRSGASAFHCMNVDTLLVGYRAAKGRRVLAYDSREHFPSMRAPSTWTRRWWMLKEKLLVPRSQIVFTVTDPIADDLKTRYEIPRPIVIYNGPTVTCGRASDVHTPLRVVHVGKFFMDRNLEELIDALALLEGEAVLRLQGWGEAEDQLRRYVHDRGLEAIVTFVPPVPPSDVVAAMNAHDVGLINIRPDSQSHRWAGPNKLFDYMAAGLAVVSSELEYVARIIADADCGLIVRERGSKPIAGVLAEMCREPGRVSQMKANSLQASEQYSWATQRNRLTRAYADVLKRREGTRSAR